MATKAVAVLKMSDAKVMAFFDKVQAQLQFPQLQTYIIGIDGHLNRNSPQVEKLLERDGYAIWRVIATRNQCVVSYTRTDDVTRFSVPDSLTVNNNQTGGLNADEMLALTELIETAFQFTPKVGLLSDETALNEVIASHQRIVTNLEESLATIAEKFSQEQLRLQSEQTKFLQQTQEDFTRREKAMRDAYEEKEAALRTREKAIDDRDHIHARRAIQQKINGKLDDFSKEFKLTQATRNLRWPIHIVVALSLIFLAVGAWYFSRGVDPAKPDTYVLLIKPALMTIAWLGILTWYIRWLNRWFEQHSDAEFYLKQFSLDVERASWVMESTMEWNSNAKSGGMPDILLQSFTKNLFARTNRDDRDEMHPADYLASALLGNASHAKLKLGEAELDYKAGALKKAADNVT